MLRPQSYALLAGALLLPVGCASKSATPENPTVIVAQRLNGTWTLRSFRPARPLGEPLQSLLDAQASALSVSFTDSTFAATGPGVNTHGRYQIDVAVGDQFSGTIYDSDGVPYDVSGRFVDSRLQFSSKSERWRGEGELERTSTR